MVVTILTLVYVAGQLLVVAGVEEVPETGLAVVLEEDHAAQLEAS